ncbi:hypothetical protein Tco_0658982 [Tanacetum coccineum]
MPSPSVSTFTFPSTTEPVFSASTSEPVFESPNHSQTSQTTQSQQLQQYHTTTVSNNNAKFPYLKKEEYETWAMKMEYWIMNSDHNLWKHCSNGNSRKEKDKKRSKRKYYDSSTWIFGWLSKPDLEVAITLKTKGGLDYLSFDDLYNKLRTLEIDVKGGSSYDSRGSSAPTHSAFISAARH